VAGEPDWRRYHRALVDHEPFLSTGTLVELGRYLTIRLADAAPDKLRDLVREFEMKVVPVDMRQAEIAVQAALDYGKGRGRAPAVLNYGDLFSYALAKALNLLLLFKGIDFAATDLRSALAEPS
jgi:ribonuclease VapC